MRRGSKGIYNRNYDTPLRHVLFLHLKRSLYNTAHLATLSPFAQYLGHLGRATGICCHPYNCPVIAFAPAHYTRMPVTPDPFYPPGHSAGRRGHDKKNVLSGFSRCDTTDGLTSSLALVPVTDPWLSPPYGAQRRDDQRMHSG
jgi:hypothetical protein